MKTIILPGFSVKNREWAKETAKHLSDFDIYIHEWFHWVTDDASDFSVEHELMRLNIKEPFNIIAKSIGTLVAVNLLKTQKINKIIFNGIPMGDIESKDLHDFEILEDQDLDKFLFIQNENDTHGSHKKVSEFLLKINPKIKVISKPRDDHEYPYWEEFRKFLSS